MRSRLRPLPCVAPRVESESGRSEGLFMAASAPRRPTGPTALAARLVSRSFTVARRVESGRRRRAVLRPDGRRRASPPWRRQALVDPDEPFERASGAATHGECHNALQPLTRPIAHCSAISNSARHFVAAHVGTTKSFRHWPSSVMGPILAWSKIFTDPVRKNGGKSIGY